MSEIQQLTQYSPIQITEDTDTYCGTTDEEYTCLTSKSDASKLEGNDE